MAVLMQRDGYSYDMTYGPPTLIFMTLVLLVGCCVATLVLLRRRRRQALQAAVLPTHRRHGHTRTLTIATTPSNSRGESIFVYDEKMNLIANFHGSPEKIIPEIRVTFPEEDGATGQRAAGRVVVLRISDTGSVGMEPLHQEPLPPYQRHDKDHFQSIDLEHIGGLRENTPQSSRRFA